MRTALSVFFLALGLTSAAAQVTDAVHPRLKSAARVSSDIVRIGDLIENAGAVANTPIFRAPDLGQTGAVASRAVLEAVSEISDLISAQRAYEMNAKVITATDQMLQSTSQMLR